MGYEYFYQNIAEWLLLSMLIFIDSPLQILMLDILFIYFLSMQPLIPPSPSQAAVDCGGVFEECKRANPLEWATQLPIGHALPSPPKCRTFPLLFVATNRAAFPSHSRFVDRRGTWRLIVVWLIFSTGKTIQFSPPTTIPPMYTISPQAKFCPVYSPPQTKPPLHCPAKYKHT